MLTENMPTPRHLMGEEIRAQHGDAQLKAAQLARKSSSKHRVLHLPMSQLPRAMKPCLSRCPSPVCVARDQRAGQEATPHSPAGP